MNHRWCVNGVLIPDNLRVIVVYLAGTDLSRPIMDHRDPCRPVSDSRGILSYSDSSDARVGGIVDLWCFQLLNKQAAWS